MAIKTKTSVRMKVAAIAAALIASLSAWAKTDWNWQSAVDGDWYDTTKWNSNGTSDGNWVIHKNLIGDNNVTVSFSEKGTTANGLWVENGNTGLVTFQGDSDDCGVEMGSTWTIGTGTAGNLKIAKGTFTANGVIYISRGGASSTLTVSGGTIGNKANDLIIADNANANCVGNLVVQNEGVVSVGYWLPAGSGANSTANITVSGGSLLIGQSTTGVANQGCFNLGGGSGATVNFTQSGGYVYAPGSRNSGTSGQAMVLGNGASTVNVTLSGGTMELDEILLIGNNASANGTFTLSGGTLKVGKIAYGSGTAVLNLNGGTIEALKETTSFLPDTSIAVSVGGNFCISNDYAITIAETIATGSYTLTKKGNGVLTFTGAVSGKVSLTSSLRSEVLKTK